MHFVPTRKGTILIPNFSTPHLHFVCNDPVFYPNSGKECVLLVNLSSPSFIYYRKADIFSSTGIQLQIAEGNYSVREDCNDSVFKRILDGFSMSEDMKNTVL